MPNRRSVLKVLGGGFILAAGSAGAERAGRCEPEWGVVACGAVPGCGYVFRSLIDNRCWGLDVALLVQK